MHEIEWPEAATDSLAEISLVYRKRWREIDTAVDLIEARLRRDPLAHSIDIAEGLRRIDSPPVALYFSIDGSTILIESVHWIG